MLRIFKFRPFLAARGTIRSLSSLQTSNVDAIKKRNTVKPLDSRKTYLVDVYTHLIRTNPILLILHHSGLVKTEDQQIRQDIKNAGGQYTMIRDKLFRVALRGLECPDPASVEARQLYRENKHPLDELLVGPTAIVSVDSMDPTAVNRIVNVIDKTNNKLILLGGQVDGSLLYRTEIDAFMKLPSFPELRAQLAGVLTILGGAGLVQTLQSTSNMLYLSLKQHNERDSK